MAQFDFLVDVENRRLVSSFLSTRAASAPSFVIGDQPTMAVRLVRGNANDPNQPWQYIEPSATQSIRVAVGNLGGAPTAGSFVMSFDGDDTAALPYDATGDEVGLALNTLASIVSAGGVTVTDLNGGGYRIAFIDNGARSLVSLDTDSLSPTTGAFVSESITGSATTSSIQLVAIETMPAAFSDLTTELPAPNVDINTIRSGVLDTTAELKQVTIAGEPYNGTYSLLIGGIESSFISWDATLEAIQAAVEAIDVTWAGLISVLGTSESYTIEFDKSLGDIGSGTANNDTLTGAKGRSGTLDLNVTGLVELLQGNSSTTATFEIQLFDTTGSVPETVLQTRCAVNQDLIPANPTSSTPIPDYALAVHTHTIPEVDGLLDGNLALGADNTATGINGSFSAGANNTVAGDFGALAIGRGNSANGGAGVISLGNTNDANGDSGVIAIGRENIANGSEGVIAIGRTNDVSGSTGSSALGINNTVSGSFGATAIGRGNEITGQFGVFAIGQANTVSGNLGCSAIGFNIINTTDGAQELGKRNQTDLSRKSALRIQDNGQVSQTLNVSATPLTASAAAVGSEANGELGVDMGALRLDTAANSLHFDYNEAGTIVTHDLTGLNNSVIVRQASDLSGVLDSTKVYKLDGIIDMGSQSITVPTTGLSIIGDTFDVSGLVSSEDNYTMFISESIAIGSGNLLMKDLKITTDGAGSKVYELYDATGFNAFELLRVNYINCTSLGDIYEYRQGLEEGTGRFGGSPSLTLHGVWLGGFRVTTSIVRSLAGTMTEPLFKEGTLFQMNSRFLTDINCDLPTLASLLDFQPINFPNASTLQLKGCEITRDGAYTSEDINITPNIANSDLASYWKSNNGIPNTFVGGVTSVITEETTVVASASTYYDLEGVFLGTGLQHFSASADGKLTHLGTTPTEYEITASLILESTSNNDLTVRFRKWDNSASSFIDLDYTEQTRQVNNLQGGRDVANFTIVVGGSLDENDYFQLQVKNNTASNNVVAEVSSFFRVQER